MLMDNDQDDLERCKAATVSLASTPTMASAATAPQLSSLKRSQIPMGEMEQTISQLLTLTKKFLEALTSWSLGEVGNEQVMATYRELAEQFDRVKAVLQAAQLSISNVAHIPDELHKCLTEALDNPPSKAVLEEHLPAIREIILRLLQSLKQKQAQLRDAPAPPSRRISSASTTSFSSCSTPSSPRAPQRISDLDMSDVSTRDALAVLNQQDNLARRSSVRRASKLSPVTPPRRHPTLIRRQEDKKDHEAEKKAMDLSAAFPLFLQVGDQVKKMMWHQPVTLAALRMAFREKFGQGHDTNIIKIQDPVSRIMYELEDMSDVGPHCLIAVSPTSQDNVSVSAKLDWIRQELLEQGRRRQQPEAGSKANHTILQQQQKQVEHLRRDLGVLRQVAQEFQQETNALLQELKLKQQEQQQRNSRRYLDETKLRAEGLANAITGRLQDLQDTIDQLKLDVTQRRCRPSNAQLEHCSTEVKAMEEQIDSLAQLIRTAKPKWKLTWEQELQQVVTEQQFLKDQEGLLLDLRDDHADLVHVLQQLQKISEIQARGNKKVVPLFRGGGGEEGMSSVLKQVSTIDVDHQKRIKALQQAEKMRARELANRIDDFEKELSTFVEAKKLKKTGGADHVDRQRQKKDQQILRDLYQSKTHNNNNNNNNNE